MTHVTLKNTLCLAALILLPTAAQADLVLDLRLDDGARTRGVASGSSVLVDMFLVDTDGSSSMSVFGLSGAGGKILASGTGAAAGTGSLVSTNPGLTDIFNPPVSPVPGLTVPGIVSLLESAPIFTSVAAGAAGVGVTSLATGMAIEVALGRFSVNVTGGLGDILTLTADRLVDFDGNIDGLGVNLDALGSFMNSSSTESVTLSVNSAAAVPEPSTFVVAGILGAGVFFARRRRFSTKPHTNQDIHGLA